MILILLRYITRTVSPTRPRPFARLDAVIGMALWRTFFSSVRLGRPLLAGLITGWGLIRWYRKEKQQQPRKVALKTQVRPGQAVAMRYMQDMTLVREEIIEG